MFEKRTDLALEVHELHGSDSGITVEESQKEGLTVTTAVVKRGIGEKNSRKSAGKYITIDTGEVRYLDKTGFLKTVSVIANEISALVPEGNGCVFVAGLGNEEITPDSIGPLTVKKLLVTRHVESMDPTLYKTAGFGCVSALSAGVLGQTGIESAEIIKSICQSIKPKCVIAVDSLASRRLARLATTVQISDAGISPGSGVYNRRTELNSELLGVPVISIGVPMVVDAATLAHDLLEEQKNADSSCFDSIVETLFSANAKNTFVTPRDIDVLTKDVSKLIASAINLALHKMSLEEIGEFMG